MNTVMPAAETSASSRGLALLRATGPAGIASAVVIAAATLTAVFGPLLAPYDPDLPNLSLSWAGQQPGQHVAALEVIPEQVAADRPCPGQ